MKIETYKQSLIARGWTQSTTEPTTFTKESAGAAGDIAWALSDDGRVMQCQHVAGRWLIIKQAHLEDFEDVLSPTGKWQFKPGRAFTQTPGETIFL